MGTIHMSQQATAGGTQLGCMDSAMLPVGMCSSNMGFLVGLTCLTWPARSSRLFMTAFMRCTTSNSALDTYNKYSMGAFVLKLGQESH